MIRRFLAFALTLALTLTIVGHIPGFEGMAAAQPLSAAPESEANAMAVPAGKVAVGMAVLAGNDCKNRYGSSGPCSFEAVPPSPLAAASLSGLIAARLSTAEARPERSWPSPRLRPPILLS